MANPYAGMSVEQLEAMDAELTSQIGDGGDGGDSGYVAMTGAQSDPRAYQPMDEPKPRKKARDRNPYMGLSLEQLEQQERMLTNMIGDGPKPKPSVMPVKPVAPPMTMPPELAAGMYAGMGRATQRANTQPMRTLIPNMPDWGYGLAEGVLSGAEGLGQAIGLPFKSADGITYLNQALAEGKTLEKNWKDFKPGQGKVAPPHPMQVAMDAGATGVLNMADTLMNVGQRLPLTPIQQGDVLAKLFGLPTVTPKPVRMDLGGAFEAQPRVQAEKALVPKAFEIHKGVANMATPIPGFNAASKASTAALAGMQFKNPVAKKLVAFAEAVESGGLAANVANEAIQGAGLGGMMSAGDQIKAGKEPELKQTAQATVAGGLLGGGLSGVIRGTPKAIGLMKKGNNAVMRQAFKSSPADEALQAEAATQAGLSAEERAALFPDSEEFQALAANQQVKGEVVEPTGTPWQQALDKIKNAQSRTEYEAALQAAGTLKKKIQAGTPKRYKDELKEQLNLADIYWRQRDVDMSPVQGRPITHTRVDTQEAPPPPINAWKKPPEELKPGERGYEGQVEQEQFPDAFKPMFREMSDDTMYLDANNPTPQGLADDELARMVDDWTAQLQDAQQRKAIADTRDAEYTLNVLTAEKNRRAASNDLSRKSEDELKEGMDTAKSPEEFDRYEQEWERRNTPPVQNEVQSPPRQAPGEVPPVAKAEFNSDGQANGQNEPSQVPEPQAPRPIDAGQNDGQYPPGIQSVLDNSNPTVQGGVTYGEYRHTMQQAGRKAIFDKASGYLHDNDRPIDAVDDIVLKGDLEEAARLKLQKDHDEFVYQDALQQFEEKFKDDPRVELRDDGKMYVKAPEKLGKNGKPLKPKDALKFWITPERKLTKEGRRVYERARFEASDDVQPTIPAHMKGMAENEFGDKVGHLQANKVQVADDLYAAIDQLDELKGAFTSSEKVYSSIKKDRIAEPFLNTQQARKADLNDPLAHLRVNVKAKTPRGDETTVQFWHQKDTLAQKFIDRADRSAAEAEAMLKELEAAQPGYTKLTRNIHKYKLAAAGTAGVLTNFLGGLKAEASDIVQQAATNPHGFWESLTPNAPLMGAAAALAVAAPKVAKHVLSKNKMVSGFLWKDVMDNVADADKMLGTNLSAEIWNKNLGVVYRSTFGVKFETAAQRQEAISALRDGTATVADALAGKAGTPFEKMTQAQRDAVVTYHGVQKNIGKLVTKQLEALDAAVKANPKLANDGTIRHAKGALNHMLDAVSPRKRGNEGERLISKGVSNFMDYNFFWNPEHHGVNLTDAWIAGASRVGPINIGRAYTALSPVGGNAKLKAVFKNSNLLGSNQADRTHAQVNSGIKAEIDDLPSDKINADRVALGSVFQFFDLAKRDSTLSGKLNGIKDAEDFAERLFVKGQLDPELAMRAWGHMAETTSRTLGVDPYRLNMDMLSIAGNSAALGVFIRQPARVARLAVQYLAEGNLRGLFYMMGATAVLGGSKAIPQEARYIWEKTDPRGFYAAAKFLDDHSISAITGESLSPKLSWGIFWPAFSTVVPLAENVTKLRDDHEKGFDVVLKHLASYATDKKVGEGFNVDMAKLSATLLSDYGSMLSPRVANVLPTRMLAKGARAYEQSESGEAKVYREGSTPFERPSTVEVKDKLQPYTDQFIPGTPNYKQTAAMAKGEAKSEQGFDDRMALLEQIMRGTPYHQQIVEIIERQKSIGQSYSVEGDGQSPFTKAREAADYVKKQGSK